MLLNTLETALPTLPAILEGAASALPTTGTCSILLVMAVLTLKPIFVGVVVTALEIDAALVPTTGTCCKRGGGVTTALILAVISGGGGGGGLLGGMPVTGETPGALIIGVRTGEGGVEIIGCFVLATRKITMARAAAISKTIIQIFIKAPTNC